VALEKKKRENLLNSERSSGAGEDIGYQAVSPHAVYDAARNQRKIAMKLEEAGMGGGHNRLEGLGLNKSEITIEETSHKSHISYSSAPSFQKEN